MVKVPVGEWLPDQPTFMNPGATVAKNVIPRISSYSSFPTVSQFSDNALDAYCRGAIAGKDQSGNTFIYAGDTSQLYRLVSTSFSDASRSGTGSTAYALATQDRWEFAQFGNTIVATQVTDNVQGTQVGSSTFSDLITSTLKPKAKHVGIVRDFVVLGNLVESSNHPQRVRWSALDDATDFSANASTQSDFQDLVGNGGEIQRVVGGEYGIIFQEQSIWRMNYIGSPLFFEFDEFEQNRGCLEPGSVVKYGSFIFYLSDDGFYMLNGATGISQPIGKNKVDSTFFKDLDSGYLYRMSSAIDPRNNLVCWTYPGEANSNGTPNKMLIYNWSVNKWALVELETEFIFRARTTGVTLEELDSISSSIDSLAFSLDSPVWVGGSIELGVFDSDSMFGYFTGTAMAGTVETTEIQFAPDQRWITTGVRPYVDGGDVTTTVQIGTRRDHTQTASYGSALSLNGIGEAPARTNARYQRFRINTSGPFDHIQGVEVRGRKAGRR